MADGRSAVGSASFEFERAGRIPSGWHILMYMPRTFPQLEEAHAA
jgi:hypothetical protein